MPELGEKENARVKGEHQDESLDSGREDLGERNPSESDGQAKSEVTETKTSEERKENAAGDGRSLDEEDSAVEQSDGNLARYRTDVKEKYPSDDESGVNGSGDRLASPTSGKKEEGKNERESDHADPLAETRNHLPRHGKAEGEPEPNGKEVVEAIAAASSESHYGDALEARRREDAIGREDKPPNETGQANLPPRSDHPKPEAAPSGRNLVGEDIRDSASLSNLPNAPDSATELPDLKTPENFVVEGSRFAGNYSDRWKTSRPSEDVLRVPEERMLVEVHASAGGGQEDLARGNKDDGRIPEERPEGRRNPIEHERDRRQTGLNPESVSRLSRRRRSGRRMMEW